MLCPFKLLILSRFPSPATIFLTPTCPPCVQRQACTPWTLLGWWIWTSVLSTTFGKMGSVTSFLTIIQTQQGKGKDGLLNVGNIVKHRAIQGSLKTSKVRKRSLNFTKSFQKFPKTRTSPRTIGRCGSEGEGIVSIASLFRRAKPAQ